MLSCNNDVRLLLKTSPALIYYTASYAFKPQQKKAADDAKLNAAFAKRVNSEYNTNADHIQNTTDVTRGRGRLLSSLYTLTQSLSTGLPLAAYYLLHDSAYVSSHDFVELQVPQLLSQLSNENCYNSFAANSYLSRAVPQLTDYQCRGSSLSLWPYYTFLALYQKVSSTASEKCTSTPIDFLTFLLLKESGLFSHESTLHVLPNNVRFTSDHPQFSTHCMQLKKRASVVILHGRRLYGLKIMSDDADDNTDDDVLSITEKRSIVAQFCLGTCKPWRNNDDLSASSTTWYDAYLAYMSSTNHTLPLANRILTHSQEYYIGKEEGKHEQAENRGLIQEDSNPNVDE